MPLKKVKFGSDRVEQVIATLSKNYPNVACYYPGGEYPALSLSKTSTQSLPRLGSAGGSKV